MVKIGLSLPTVSLIFAMSVGSPLAMAVAKTGGIATPLMGLSPAPVSAPISGASQSPAEGSTTLLAPGDQLAITVRSYADLTVAEMVRPDGKIAYPVLQTVQVAGRTADQVREEITNRLSTLIRNPDVTVIVVAYHSQSIYVVGSVRAYGPFPFSPGLTVQEALHLAGGPTMDGDMEHVTVIRDHKTAADLDLSTDHSPAFLLLNGDMVLVPKLQPAVITLVGAVTRPGSQELVTKDEKILDAITASTGPAASDSTTGSTTGGNLSVDADLAHVTLTRGKNIQTIDVEAIIAGNLAGNLVLESGDVIYVPVAARVTVVGAVHQPGSYSVHKGEKMLDVLTEAGVAAPADYGMAMANTNAAATETATPDLAHTTITRGGNVMTFDLTSIWKGDATANIVVQPGDVIYVPALHGMATVLGQVKIPMTAILTPGARVLDLLNLAGGVTPSGDPHKAVIKRLGGQEIPVDLEALLKGSDASQNVLLQDGDILSVPVNPYQVAVLGSVNKPGIYTFRPGDDVLAAVVLAGGTSATASLNQVGLLRYHENAQPEHFKVNVGKIMNSDFRTDQKLQPGDVVYVAPKSATGGIWEQMVPVLSIISSFKYLVPGLL